MVFEIFQTMREYDEDRPTHCPTCDPTELKEGTLHQVHFKGSLPKFKIKDGGFYPNKMQ